MAMLFIDYTNLLLKDFEEKKSANLLSPLLVNPTTVQIKKECLHVYADRLKKGVRTEDNTLRAFFGVPPVGNDFSFVIDQTDPDKFRPLQSFIKGRIKNPSSENVELLAWLIDFNFRPYGRAKEISLKEDSIGKISVDRESLEIPILFIEDIEVKTKNEFVEPNLPLLKESSPKGSSKLKWVAAIILIIATLFGTMYFTTNQKSTYGNVNTGECMTWVNDHYEKVACSSKRERNRIIVPFDDETMRTFKRITKEDTISASSIGYIYYIKMNGSREYYTRSGYHPIEVNRPLKVLSQYIYRTYLEDKESLTKDVSSK